MSMEAKQKNENTNIVAEFNITDSIDMKTQYLIEYTTCVLCGSELDFTHVTNFVYNQVEEISRCESCDIQNKRESHKLQ